MKKKVIARALSGIPGGICIGYLITLAISATAGDGLYHPVSNGFLELCNTQLNAVLLETLLYAIFGSVCAAASAIWEVDHWSLMKQTILHLLAISITLFPIAYLSYWMEHTVAGVLRYIGIFAISYLVIWLVQYLSLRKRIKEINRQI